MSHTTSSIASAIPSSAVHSRSFTVRNGCDFTIWPAIFTDLNQGSAVPDHVTGWEARSNTQETFDVPDNWTAGRIWARRSCDFSNDSDEPSSCLDGGCNGGLICDPDNGTGVPPATVAEFTLHGDGKHDWYDVSLVDGFNLPIHINSTAGCGIASCPVDINSQCPEALKLKGPDDSTVGCNSACSAKIDGKPEDSANCCTGNHSTPETCPSSGVDHYGFFKKSCPDSVAYAFDQTSGTALWTCNSKHGANYTITFCP
ncbi:Osmotin, thaumatin-like protein [Cylindrobasidium torrendii FP15055 ss-10]|uniref:Osmotin, thaumatin-like protein n=1 Tax=Cylindrobasidium torrendii FP15055 ss-10 TaxID=1314674 RepID=A0A0D7BDZ6_9AGAR|nr:Osmotin, thaumatin-like protein [Cylindrobasidium torrendii FP15055 ss-10]